MTEQQPTARQLDIAKSILAFLEDDEELQDDLNRMQQGQLTITWSGAGGSIKAWIEKHYTRRKMNAA